ncbi:MAG: Fe-S oxidoreductase [Proteobacteria bacterium]|nr:Fe-S oxidoreductase [Burkholderiales bacterium]
MTVLEGSLQAPIRHPIDWKNPRFWDQAALDAELERVFDICHGCRRCVSLCGAFPRLFDLVDESPTLEVDGIPKEKYRDVVDQCYLCDMCYMTKCPYVPPHPWNVDFPHLMLRAKAVAFRQRGAGLRDRVLSSTDGLGRLAGIPVVTATVNAVNQTQVARSVLEKTLGVDARAWRPDYAKRKFRASAKAAGSIEVRAGERTPGKVAIYATCYVNYNEPGIGHDLLQILDHNRIPYRLVSKEVCCGMPKLELGDLDAVEALKRSNVPRLAEVAREGYAIVSAVPSCTLMFKQELPLLFPDDEDVQVVKKAMWDPFEYLVARHRDGLLDTAFTRPLGNVSYHVPCHARVQNIGRKTEEFLKLVPQLKLTTVERCSGHSGTWGVKKEFHAQAMKIGKPVFRSMAAADPDWLSSDCQLAGHHIAQGVAALDAGAGGSAGATASVDAKPAPKVAHPITLVRLAYGL